MSDQWLSMVTVPKDGTPVILLIVSRFKHDERTSFDGYLARYGRDEDGEGFWMGVNSDCFVVEVDAPGLVGWIPSPPIDLNFKGATEPK